MKRIIAAALLGAFCAFGPSALAQAQVEPSDILFLKQEEKLARDVYTKMYEKWGHATFKNIAVSEQRHMDAVDGLIARYGLVDDSSDDVSVFTLEEIQALYDALIEEGNQSLQAALGVGVKIELMDIEDLNQMLAVAKDRPVIRVLSNLLQGSKNHLEAFNNALEQLAASDAGSVAVTCGQTCGSRQSAGLPAGQGQQRRKGR